MTDDQFAELIQRGYETRGIEFKGAGRRDDSYFFAKVTRAILGMANTRDGGLVIIGVEDNRSALVATGLGTTELATWAYDDIVSALAPYADPAVRVELEQKVYQAATCMIIRVLEFEEIPVLCNRAYDKGSEHVLRKGACYVRSIKKPETSEIPSQEEMRALLELATEKGIRRFLNRAYNAGLPVTTPAQPSNAEQYARELGDLA